MYLQWPPPVLATMTEYIKLQKHISCDRIHISKDRNIYPIRTDRNIYPMTETYIKWKKHMSYDRNIYPKTETYILWQNPSVKWQKYLSNDDLHLSNDRNIYPMTDKISITTWTEYMNSMSECIRVYLHSIPWQYVSHTMGRYININCTNIQLKTALVICRMPNAFWGRWEPFYVIFVLSEGFS